MSLNAWKAEQQERLRPLRARARRLGLFIRSCRGTGYGYYYLQNDEHQVGCDGLEGLDRELTYLERVVPVTDARPTPAEIARAFHAVSEVKQREWEAIERARPVRPCEYCGAPRDAENVYRVGPEDIPPNEWYWWVHVRCYDAYGERNLRHLEVLGYGRSGIKVVREGGA